ncbi:acetate--CoA ligase family protein [Granulosicoccus antarcticus]|uniref:ATP-grasp domain-containing protein n=1 Tax=Granulosicoccus antarcticus IMCC3135 TaxID=1192854 RepID=A0A2Z2NSJ7_9GAMM|nr:acetate--CoA ligase family protein [Granulosicoccus antarcticus]ASJ72991.1 hypothetical protein IMCC3135_14530 [Granulosicoccus antarcticus IMCC3135]
MPLQAGHLSKALLRNAGVSVPEFVVGSTVETLAGNAHALTPPLAMKGLGFLHKSEAGAVRLNLASLNEQTEMAGANGYLAEEMVTDGVAELLVGLRRVKPYGLVIVLGSGGTAAELLSDTVTLIAPVTAAEVQTSLRKLQLWPLLDGFRGRPCADVTSAVTTVMQLQQLALEHEDLIDIEINPLILRTHGAVAVDAVIRTIAGTGTW